MPINRPREAVKLQTINRFLYDNRRQYNILVSYFFSKVRQISGFTFLSSIYHTDCNKNVVETSHIRQFFEAHTFVVKRRAWEESLKIPNWHCWRNCKINAGNPIFDNISEARFYQLKDKCCRLLLLLVHINRQLSLWSEQILFELGPANHFLMHFRLTVSLLHEPERRKEV